MKTFYFQYSGGWIGGTGVVVAPDAEAALQLANSAILEAPFSREHSIITIDELKECPENTCEIITNGDY